MPLPIVHNESFVPLDEATQTDASVFQCALCGGRFTHGQQVCAHCVLNAGCDLVRCPHCGYGFPRSSLILKWLRAIGRWIGYGKKP